MRNNSINQIEAYDISMFCMAHNISRAFFYKLDEQGLAPKTMKLGRRVLISKEAAAAWRRKMTNKH